MSGGNQQEQRTTLVEIRALLTKKKQERRPQSTELSSNRNSCTNANQINLPVDFQPRLAQDNLLHHRFINSKEYYKL